LLVVTPLHVGGGGGADDGALALVLQQAGGRADDNASALLAVPSLGRAMAVGQTTVPWHRWPFPCLLA
jgi:hypothetical protein